MGRFQSLVTFPFQIISLSFVGLVLCTYILIADQTVYDNPTKKAKLSNPLEAFTIYYAKGVASISKTDQARLQKFAEYLVSNPTKEIRIESHAFLEGNTDQELLLSEKRSVAVERFFQVHGVLESQIRRFFYGGSRSESTTEPQLNRQTKISLNR